MVELENVSCNNCGAPLEVPDTVSFVTCNHCNTRLAIRRTESTTFTEKLESIESQQNVMLEKLESLERQNAIARVDRLWESEKKKYMVKGNDGGSYEPSEAMAVMPVVVGVVVLLVSIGMSAQLSGAFVIGIIGLCVGIGTSLYLMEKTKEFRRAKKRYRRRRIEVARRKPANDFEQKLENIPTPMEYLKDLESD
jgi:hypothetical protein